MKVQIRQECPHTHTSLLLMKVQRWKIIKGN